MSFTTLYWSKIGAACVTLVLALTYLFGFAKSALVGLVCVGLIGGFIGYRIKNGRLAAICDLCGSEGWFSAEYGTGFSNTRLILNCSKCGRIVNKAPHGVKPQRDGTRGG